MSRPSTPTAACSKMVLSHTSTMPAAFLPGWNTDPARMFSGAIHIWVPCRAASRWVAIDWLDQCSCTGSASWQKITIVPGRSLLK